jgi:hypothetical protein
MIEGYVKPCFIELAQDYSKECTNLKHNMDTSCAKYEGVLDASLQSRNKLSEADAESIINSRKTYELNRFDLVECLNKWDCSKKILVNKAILTLYAAIAKGWNDLSKIASERSEEHFAALKNQVVDADAIIKRSESLWIATRAKLAGEIDGHMPPPGSPLGALAPVQPRSHFGMPIYSAVLTTEVLKASTREASFSDTRHARDDAVFKQGYLFVSEGTFFRKRRRKWHRLYGTQLYVFEHASARLLQTSGNAACEVILLCDMKDSMVSVCTNSEGLPHMFTIQTVAGKTHEFQGENEDALVKWVSALRRCSGIRASPSPAAQLVKKAHSEGSSGLGKGMFGFLRASMNSYPNANSKSVEEDVLANGDSKEKKGTPEISSDEGPCTWKSIDSTNDSKIIKFVDKTEQKESKQKSDCEGVDDVQTLPGSSLAQFVQTNAYCVECGGE